MSLVLGKGRDLCAVMVERAEAVHELIGYSYDALHPTLGVGEESITDMLMVELRRQLDRSCFLIKKYNRHEESATYGADWLWVVGRPGKWLKLLVQAKLLRPARGSLRSLHKPKNQLATLQRCALTHRCVPLYVIYTSLSSRELPRRHSSFCVRARPDAVGILAVEAHHVARMKTEKPSTGVERLLDGAIPLAELFCPYPPRPPDGDLAGSLLDALKGFRNWSIAARQESRDERQGSRGDEPVLDETLFSSEERPPLVERLLLDGPQAMELQIERLVVLSSEPLRLGNRREGR